MYVYMNIYVQYTHGTYIHAQAYRLVPMGSFSRVFKREDDKLVYDLYCSSGVFVFVFVCACVISHI